MHYIIFGVWGEAIGKSEQVKSVRAGLRRSGRNAKAKWNEGNNLLNYNNNTKEVLLSDLKAEALEGLQTSGLEGMTLWRV